MKRLLYTCFGVAIVTSAMALSTFNKVFHDKYNVKPGSNIGKAACGVCHLKPKGGALNAYGKDIKAAMKAANTKKLTPAVLSAVEGLDSNKNGKSNAADIKSDTLPG